MRIKAADVRNVNVPYGPDGFKPSWLPGVTQNTYSQTLVRLFSDTGEVGIASTNCFGSEVYDFTHDVLPAFLGNSLDTREDLSRIWEKICQRSRRDDPSSMLSVVVSEALSGNSGRDINWLTVLRNFGAEPSRIPLLSARNIPLDHRHWYLNVALWDLYAREKGDPIATCLGRNRSSVPAYASTGEVVHRGMMDFLQTCREQGYESIKLRIKDPDPQGEELQLVREIVESSPESFTIGIDANEGWSLLPPYWNYQDARNAGKFLESLNAGWLEEPLGCLATDEISRLTQSLSLETVGGELEAGLDRQRELLGAYSTVNPDICMSIGFSEGMELAEDACDRGSHFTPHTWGLGPSVAAGLQIACAMPECDRLEFPYDPSWPIEYRDAFLRDPLEVEEGQLELPELSGLGIRLDHDILEDVTVDKHHLGPPTD